MRERSYQLSPGWGGATGYSFLAGHLQNMRGRVAGRGIWVIMASWVGAPLQQIPAFSGLLLHPACSLTCAPLSVSARALASPL